MELTLPLLRIVVNSDRCGAIKNSQSSCLCSLLRRRASQLFTERVGVLVDGIQRGSGQRLGTDVWFACWNTELIKRMSKETDSTLAERTIIAQLSAVAGGVEPVLKDIVSVWATITTDTVARLLHVWTGDAGVCVETGVPADCLLSCMCKGADRPVVDESFGAWDDFHAPDSKVVRLEEGGVGIIISGDGTSSGGIIEG